jgi:hypothetical protein
MHLLLDLPEALVTAALKLWVDFMGLGRLDSAMCNKSTRANILSLMRENNCHTVQQYDPSHGGENLERADQFLSWVMQRDINVARLVVTVAFVNGRARVAYLKRHGKHIQHVTLRLGKNVTSNCAEIVLDLCRYCPGVLMFESYLSLPATVQTAIAAHWKQLTHLTMVDEYREMGEALVSIGKNCQALMELTLTGGSTEGHFSAFLRCCSARLQNITIFAQPQPDDYLTIASRLPLLRTLSVHTDDMDDASLIALAAGCPLFSTLDLENSANVTDVGIAAVARNRALTALWIDNCDNPTDESLRIAAENCPLLEDVYIGWGVHFTDAALIALGQHCRNLRILNVSNLRITHVGIGAVAAGCPLLEDLSVVWCREIGSAIEAIARGCPCLRKLDMTGVEQVPIQTVLALAECCPLLEDVSLCDYTDIDDEKITALVRGCPLLTSLDISNTHVTDIGMNAIRDNCSNLMEITLDERFRGAHELVAFFPPTVKVTYVTWHGETVSLFH